MIGSEVRVQDLLLFLAYNTLKKQRNSKKKKATKQPPVCTQHMHFIMNKSILVISWVENVRFVPLTFCFKCIVMAVGCVKNYLKKPTTDESMSHFKKTMRDLRIHSSTVHIVSSITSSSSSSYENKTWQLLEIL